MAAAATFTHRSCALGRTLITGACAFAVLATAALPAKSAPGGSSLGNGESRLGARLAIVATPRS